MSKLSTRINIWIKPNELIVTDDLCRRKGYKRSTFIREVLNICAEKNLSPDELAEVLADYDYLRNEVRKMSDHKSLGLPW